MTWELHAHEEFVAELDDLSREDRSRVDEAIDKLVAYVEATQGALGPAAPELGPNVPRPDLRALTDSSVRGSYRLRIGDLRVALAVLPAESMVLMTVLRRRSETTYPDLVRAHERRLADR